MPNIRKMLNLSTAHLPEEIGSNQEDDNLLTIDGVIAFELDCYGYLMWIPDNVESHNADYPNIPAPVATIQAYARKHGCDYVRFDCDADEDPDLPTWNW